MTNITTKSRLRGQDFINLDELKIPITIIGAGSIGSFTTLALTKIGAEDVTVYDFDDVDEVNIGCQIYGSDHIGHKKVDCLQDIINGLTDIKIKTQEKRFDGVCTPIVISAVDSMEARREIWELVKNNGNIDHYIDGRMGGEYIHIISVDLMNKDDIARYEKGLGLKEVEATPCSARGIAYNTLIIGGLITQQIKRIIKKEPYSKDIIFDLPSLQLLASL